MSSQIKSLDELDVFVGDLVKQFSNKQLVLLKGTLGAGKTELVKRVLKHLGNDEVASPTYGLIHEYETPKRKNIYHIDLYRIEDEEDLESSGFWDLFEKPEGLIFVEWADRVPRDQFPLHWETIEIEIQKSKSTQDRIYIL